MRPENKYTGDSEYWKKYIKGRPAIPPSLFERIFSYHESKGGQFEYAHDVGAGAGVHSPRLAVAFSRVLVSDVDEKNIRTAQAQLQRDDGEVYSFRVTDLEDASSAPLSSVDLYFASNAFHWCDKGRGMEAAATQLKPGGTLALLVFGMRIFKDAKVQELWCELFRMGMKKRGMKGYMSNVVQQTWHMYDWIAVPESLFRPGVERVQFNVPEDWSRTAERITGLGRLPDGVGRDDRISVEQDDAWGFSMTLEDIKFAFTSFNFDVDGDEDMARLWKEMESAVGERTVEGITFGHLILATRR